MRTDRDPRLSDDTVRSVPASNDGDEVVLVGVVHDHPASKYRVRTVVDAVDPDVLALELPPFSIPLFERYAEDERTPPAFGGEMSTAIQAASTGAVEGIDGPSARFVIRLFGTLVRAGASATTTRKVVRSLASVTRNAIVCRLAATLAASMGVRVEVDSPVEHDCRWDDQPQVQANDERSQIRRAEAVASVFGTPDAISLRESVREAHMAARLSTLRRSGSVVAVVGYDHLGPLAERLGRET